MKKTLAILLALALVFSTITVAFAEETLPADAQAAKELGMLVGGGNGVTADYLATAPTRMQAAIMVLRLKGLENEAKAFTGAANFADADQAAWAKPIMAYLKANPTVGFGGVGNDKFNPNGLMDAKSYYKVMLETLGYKQNTTDVVGDFTWDNLLTFAAEKNLKTVANATNFTVGNLATATIESLKANVKGGTKTLAQSLVDAKVITQEAAVKAGVAQAAAALAVDSVTAKTAKSFVVKFNTAVADTAKIAATVTRGSVNVTLTSAWNDAKTELTLSSSAKLVEDTYKIVVKNDATELKTADIKIEQEKVAKIEFLSDTLVRANDYEGYVPVKVTNQYGEDITNAPIANNVDFEGGDPNTAELVKNTNKVKIVKGSSSTTSLTDLRYMTIVVVTAFDSNSGAFASKTLKVSDTVGGIAEITFKGLVDKSGKAATLSQSTTEKVFMSYEAKDAFGNIVDDYATLNNQNIVKFMSSNNSLATITVDHNAANSTKADLVVTVQDTTSQWVIDMPVIFTAVAYTGGKSATYSTTVARKASVASFNVTAPTVEVAAGETAVIPYTAYDQAGKQLNSFADLNNAATITVSPNTVANPVTVIQERAANGNYMLKMTFQNKGKYYITAMVPNSGKMSQFAVDVRDAAKPASLASIDGLFYPYYAPGASQTKDYTGYNGGGLDNLVRDQYDRPFDMKYQTRYALIATSDNTSIITMQTATTDDVEVNEGDWLKAVATTNATLGTATVTIKLVDTTLAPTDAKYVIEERSTRITKIKVDDIAKYEITGVADLFATGHSTYSNGTAARAGWEVVTGVIGRTAGGAKVRIPSSMVVARTMSDARFGWNGAYMYAGNLGTNVTEASATAFATVMANGTLYTAQAPVKAFSSQPVAEDIYLSTSGVFDPSVVFDKALNTYTMSKSQFDEMIGASIYQFDADGTALDSAAFPYFYAEVADNHGGWGLLPAYTSITRLSGSGTAKFAVDKNGVVTSLDLDGNKDNGIQTGTTVAGDEYQMQLVSSNGLVATYKIVLE